MKFLKDDCGFYNKDIKKKKERWGHWMYSLIKDEGEVKLCELYVLRDGYFYVPVSWVTLFRNPITIIKDLIYQRRCLMMIPCGEFLEEQITEICLDYNQNYNGKK